ncbi:radical SAM/SPASM domain-containing protein [Faecalispora jeddahensis]|uniref:radical SAM/SPASM domain-containing protein n=1 Tax=Faecalispora jeddahensis TaxID=1414721 RepID=UPI00189B8A49|nr:radical SAM protein [Faecalispora jeddahensis]
MYFKQKSNVIFRNYGDFGYITDNRNFGYRQAVDDGNDIGDRIVSQSGAVFLSVLDRKPQTLDCLIKKISMQFTDADIETIKIDARDFYCALESAGFIVSGDTMQECNKKDVGFSYKKGSYAQNGGSNKSTQDFFEEYFKGQPQLTNLHMEITSKCNERCIHCYIPHENKLHDIDPVLFYNVLDQCKKMNLLHLTISGGEPMAHHDFINFLKKCNEYNFSINILSNLTLLNKYVIEEMKKNPLLSIQTSLYSMDADIHDAITQRRGSFEKTKNAILTLIENDIPLQISCPILKQNINSYMDVVNWGKAHNINVGSDYVIIAKYDHTTQNLSNRLSLDDIKQIMNQRIIIEPQYLEKMKKDTESRENINPDDFICSVCHSSICIAENGAVYPCAGWQDYIVGNIKETSLDNIWNNSEKVQYLRDLRRRDFPKCMKCSEYKYCTMCMVRNANEHPSGNPLAVNEFYCGIAKISRNMVKDELFLRRVD